MCCFFMLSAIVGVVIYDWWKRREWVTGLHKKAVFITGCDSGFGAAVARSLYARGVHVYAGCYTESGARKLQQDTGTRLKTVLLDVSNSDSILKTAQYINDTLPQDIELWGIINNAGIPGYALPVEFLTKQDFQDVLDINLLGMVEVTQAFLPLLKKSKGRIVNMTSLASDFPLPRVSPYCVSKWAAKAFSESLRLEMAIWGVKVATIQPGFFQTNLTAAVVEQVKQRWREADPEVKEEYGEDFGPEYIQAILDKQSNAPADLSPVVKAYEHALFSVKPRCVYYPGAACPLHLLAFLPSSIQGCIMEKLSQSMKILPKALQNGS